MKFAVIGVCAFALAGCAAQLERNAVLSSSAVVAPISATVQSAERMPPAGQQWLYGSAEGAVASVQVYKAMTDFVLNQVKIRPSQGVILIEQQGSGASEPSRSPKFYTCGSKPLAAVFDADETLIWNVGAMRYMAEQGTEFDPAIWDQWEKTGAGKALAMPGAVAALNTMRKFGVTIVANTNRTSVNAKGSEDALRAAGLGEFKHGETLFLMGDTPDGSSKDARRTKIAEKFCVIAMAGDQLGDFSQRFNQKSNSVADRKTLSLDHSAVISDLWANGWFMFSNPLYGPSIRGSFDEIYSAETKWAPKP